MERIINELIKASGINTNLISDGYHTFGELYDHRFELYIALCKQLSGHYIWRSQVHSDGTSYDGWFMLGIGSTPGSQVSYHLPLSRWSETDFAITLVEAPEFDEHTSFDVLRRLKTLK